MRGMMRAACWRSPAQDFVKTARAKGCARGRDHAPARARNAMLPIMTFAGIQAGQLVGGAVLAETVFAWPGIGRLMFDALRAARL